jgi:methyl-accepting chemotaxis protein
VSDIMAEISAGSAEQAQGVNQIGEAVTQMDQTTQQNAALVEQMSAAADSLRGQANDLVQAVAVFKLAADGGPTPARAATPPRGRAAAAAPTALGQRPGMKQVARAPQTPKALMGRREPELAQADDNWESF